MRSDLMRSDLMRSDLMRSDLMRSDLGSSDLFGSDLMGSDLMGSDPVGSDPVGSDPNRFVMLKPNQGRAAAGARCCASCADIARATPLVQPKPSWAGYSPPPARLLMSSTSYFSVIFPVTR